ncbi:putative aminotransferase [Lachnellula occidentalis]|uniref:Putative aminotransferase n=1 Tax=Lachnellula occidentalis TaxID=215460 RepID=A0A8H8S7T6_9HELO|nr:putative aminotransferase [Lachnellula occidentalis]
MTPPLETSSPRASVNETQKSQTSSVFHRSMDEDFLKIISADGIYLNLENGQRILDATGGPAVACLGHNNPSVKAAMVAQINSTAYCHSMFFTTEATEQLCDKLIRGTGGQMSKAFIASSGSEAIEAAIKMARQYFVELEGPNTKRQDFISRKPGFHGTTIGALSLGGHPLRRKLFEPLLGKYVSHVSPCYEYRGLEDGESQDGYVKRLAQELDDEFRRLGPGTVCAFAAETVVGSALGCVSPLPGYFAAMKRVCDKHGALLILDEVMCGMGRCGYLHAWQSPDVNVVPDIQTIGKGLGGGYAPISAMLIGKKIVDVVSSGSGAFNHGHTYQAHPVACAAALAVQNVIEDEGLVGRVRALGAILGAGLKSQLSKRWYVGDVRGVGLFWAIEFVKNKQTREPFNVSQQIGFRIHKVGISVPYSILLYPGGGYADGSTSDHILVAPPYTCSVNDIQYIVTTVGRVLDDFFNRSDSPKEFE